MVQWLYFCQLNISYLSPFSCQIKCQTLLPTHDMSISLGFLHISSPIFQLPALSDFAVFSLGSHSKDQKGLWDGAAPFRERCWHVAHDEKSWFLEHVLPWHPPETWSASNNKWLSLHELRKVWAVLRKK